MNHQCEKLSTSDEFGTLVDLQVLSGDTNFCSSIIEPPTGKFGTFNPITLETKALYDYYIDFLPEAVTSPLFFQSLFAWNFVAVNKFNILDEHLCFVVDDKVAGKTYALPPLGKLDEKSFASAVCAVIDEFEREGLPCAFHEVPGFMLPYFSGIEGYRAEVSYDRDWSEYVYTKDDLAEGIQHGNLKWSRRDFERKFHPSARNMTRSDKDIVRDITQKFFCAGRDCLSCICGCELEVVSQIMASWDELGMKGIMIESDGEALAFGIVCFQKDTVFFISKKVRHRTRGLDAYLTAAMLEGLFAEYRYINYSDDLGNEGLRVYKTNLAIHTLMHRYEVLLQRA